MRKSLLLLAIFALFLPLVFLGCEGDDGTSGKSSLVETTTLAQGDTNCPTGGEMIVTGIDDNGNGILDTGEVDSTSFVCNGADVAAAADLESCFICHDGDVARNGVTHQEAYNQLYQDNVIVITNLAYANDNVSDIVTFNMTKAGQPFDCTELDAFRDPPDGTGSSLGIYFTEYTAASRSFDQPAPLTARLSIGNQFSVSSSGTVTPSTLSYNPATNLCTSTKAQSAAGDLSALNGLIVVYGRNDSLSGADESPELAFTRVVQTRFPFAAILPTGTFAIGTYTSAANVAGCEKCHTIPFLKHGYIYGQVGADPANDFYTCKACHLDNGPGGHFVWQLLVNDPRLIITLEEEFGSRWETLAAADPRLASYQYRTRLMNDVHMSHAMEFPYPQSMSNCVVCHENKLGDVLTDTNFVIETCKSCHPVTAARYAVDNASYVDTHRAPALEDILPLQGSITAHNPPFALACNGCHNGTPSGFAPVFGAVHTGFDTQIYYAEGQAYRDAITVSINDNASYNPATHTLTWSFSATGSAGAGDSAADSADIVPSVLVGLYGYETKDYIQGPHESDPLNHKNSRTPTPDTLRALEYEVGASPVTGRNSPYIQVSGGNVTVDLSQVPQWVSWIDCSVITRVELAVIAELENAAGDVVALNAPSRTFNIVTNAFQNFYPAIVKVVGGCNNCHDALGRTFHGPDRGGNIVVCRLCHITKAGGSHLEMQSRSIDSYAHAIHSFQAFDPGDVDFTDPVEALHYDDHVKFAFPTLGRTNCVSCHVAGMFNVPDQTKSFPSISSGSDTFQGRTRNIGTVPRYIMGPASRACGGCHRANFINNDDSGGLASFNSHVKSNGYLIQTTTGTQEQDILDVIDVIYGIL